MSLERFIAHSKQGLTRTNRYNVTIYPPPAVPVGGGFTERLMLYSDTATLPGISMNTMPQRITGEPREFVYERNLDPCNITFYVDAGMDNKRFFDAWQAAIIDPVTRTSGYYENYVTTIQIDIIPVYDSGPTYTMYLLEAYPKSVGSVQLSAQSRDVMTLNVGFVYKGYATT